MQSQSEALQHYPTTVLIVSARGTLTKPIKILQSMSLLEESSAGSNFLGESVSSRKPHVKVRVEQKSKARDNKLVKN